MKRKLKINDNLKEFIQKYGTKSVQKQTKIPVPLLNKILNNEPVNISKATKTKLQNAYKRENYNYLRQFDISRKEATKARNLSYSKQKIFIDNLDKKYTAREAYYIATNKDLPYIEKYQMLRDSGAPEIYAKKAAKMPLDYVINLSEKYLDIAKRIAEGNNKNIHDVLIGIRKNYKKPQEWETYIKLRDKMKWAPIHYNYKTKKYQLNNQTNTTKKLDVYLNQIIK